MRRLFLLALFVTPALLSKAQTIHVYVALCDNTYQGIVPVPKSIGNGQDPATNLYWGCSNGVRSYFKKSREWQLLSVSKPGGMLLERLVFRHRVKNFYLVADAYDGKYIRDCTVDFLNSCAGRSKDYLQVENRRIGIGGNASLLAYVGHNGLMDFKLPLAFKNQDGKTRQAIVLACISRSYFAPYLLQAKADPLLLTTGLMAPEAYTLHDAISGFIEGDNTEGIRDRGARAYARFQKCSLKAARNLLVTGW